VHSNRGTLLTAALCAAAVLLTAAVAAQPAAPAAPAAPPTPAVPPVPATPSVPDEHALEAQLEVARKRLEEAAHEVEQISTRLSGTLIDGMVPYVETGRAVIGAQLEGNADSGGARVTLVSPGGPAADAGIEAGDVIVAVNGKSTTGGAPVREVMGFMRDVKPDSRVTLRVLRAGKPRDFVVIARAGPSHLVTSRTLPLIELPPLPEMPDMRGLYMFRRPLGDMELATLTPGLGSYFGTAHGVLVVRAPADGALKLEDGDVILAIDGREPTSGSHATRILGSYQSGEKITLRLLRQHKTIELQATLPEEPARGRRELMREHIAPARARPQRAVVYGTDSA
jgi:predicted metalloprotease with PDZ domain